MPRSILLPVLPAALLFTACQTAGAPAAHPAHSPAPLRADILGTYTWSVTTRSPTAQAYFDQGLRLMYGFAREEARRSFVQARTADSTCAMCWWGEGWTSGPYLNSPMSPDDAPAAHAAAQRARALAPAASPLEREVIEALAARYLPTHPAGGRRGLDSAYADAMAGVYARNRAHPDVATLYAEALMLLEPRRGVWPLSKPSVRLIHEVLQGVLAADVGHPGACHAYIHATETTPTVVDAQRCADLLGASIPGVSHVVHMPSHTYNRVGRWGDAARVNLEAVERDRRADRGDGYAIYPAHNLHMLLYSAAVDGQEQVATQAASDFAAMVPADGAGFQALVLLRFGRFDALLGLRRAPENPIAEGLWAFARGMAHLRLRQSDSAAVYLERVDSLARTTPRTRMFRVHEPARLLGIVREILRGEMLRTAGSPDDAIAAFRAAAELEAGLTYDEPEPLPFTSHDFLGAALLEAGRPLEAVEVYQAALTARPGNGWSLFGLEQALRAAGRAEEADAARVRFATAWSRSRAVLPASRF